MDGCKDGNRYQLRNYIYIHCLISVRLHVISAADGFLVSSIATDARVGKQADQPTRRKYRWLRAAGIGHASTREKVQPLLENPTEF